MSFLILFLELKLSRQYYLNTESYLKYMQLKIHVTIYKNTSSNVDCSWEVKI